MQKLTSLTFIISTCIIFLILPAIVLSFMTPYYQDAFRRYHTYANFTPNWSKQDLDIRFGEVLAMIQPPFNSTLDFQFFSAEDRLHMQDVQRIFIYMYLILGLALAAQIGSSVILFLKTYRDQTARTLGAVEKVVGMILVFIVIGGILFLWNWERSFILFHQILFPFNNYWQLDPATSNLIKFLPAGIFQELLFLYLAFLVFEYVTWRMGTIVYKRAYT